jgi:hypothetical protein
LLAVEELVTNPFAGIKLRGELDGLLRWRTGDYRIVYKIDEDFELSPQLPQRAHRTYSFLNFRLQGLPYSISEHRSLHPPDYGQYENDATNRCIR